MSNQFKPGDLALVIRCKLVPEMVGKCVELCECVHPNETSFHPGGPWINDGDEPCWIVAGDGLLSNSVRQGVAPHPFSMLPESHLRPLRGDFQPEQQQKKEAVHG